MCRPKFDTEGLYFSYCPFGANEQGAKDALRAFDDAEFLLSLADYLLYRDN